MFTVIQAPGGGILANPNGSIASGQECCCESPCTNDCSGCRNPLTWDSAAVGASGESLSQSLTGTCDYGTGSAPIGVTFEVKCVSGSWLMKMTTGRSTYLYELTVPGSPCPPLGTFTLNAIGTPDPSIGSTLSVTLS